MAWPVGYMQQALYVEQLLERLNRASTLSTTITINSFYEPTSDQWDAAYVAQTRQPLPIPVGTKLLWQDLRSGRMHPYSKAFNEEDGADTDHTIYPAIDRNYNRGAMQLLAVKHFNTGFHNVYERMGSVASFNTNYIEWARRGLDSLLIVYHLRGKGHGTGFGPRLNIFFNEIYEPVWGSVGQSGGANVFNQLIRLSPSGMTISAGGGGTGETLRPIQRTDASLANDGYFPSEPMYDVGLIWISDPILMWNQQTDTHNFNTARGLSLIHIGGNWDTAGNYAANNAAITIGSVSMGDNMPPFLSIDLVTTQEMFGLDGTGSLGTPLIERAVYDEGSVAWMYGFMNNYTGEPSEYV